MNSINNINILLSVILIAGFLSLIIMMKQNLKSKLLNQLLIALVSITAIGSTIALFVTVNSEDFVKQVTVTNEQTKPEQVEITAVPDKIELTYTPVELKEKTEFNKKDALDTLITLLKDVQSAVNEDSTIEKTFNLIANGEKKPNEVVKEEVLARYHLADFMKDDRAYQTTTLALLGFIQGLEMYENKEIKAIENAEEFIYLDDVSKTAYIPLDIFTGRAGAVSFEMVYDGNTWKFAPYSFLQSVQLSSSIQQSNLNQESEQ